MVSRRGCEVSRCDRRGKVNGDEPRCGGAKEGMDWVARGGGADATAVYANGGAGRQRLAGVGIRGCGGALAIELRHASGCIRERAGSIMGAVAAAVFVAARVRAWAAGEEIWKRGGAAERPDSGAFVGEYLGARVEQCLSADGLA